MNLAPALLDALGLVAPVECAGCREPGRSLCRNCVRACRARVTAARLPSGTPVFAALRYEGVVRCGILSFKERGRTDIARPLGVALAAAIARALEVQPPGSRPVLVALPSGRRARVRRGFDPVAVLLRASGFRSKRVLVVKASGSAQKSLDRQSRLANRASFVQARRPLRGLEAVIVDDVVTTGATLAAAESAVIAAGGMVRAAVVLASTPKRFDPHDVLGQLS